MALRAFYFIRTLTKALTYYYINRSQRYLLVANEKTRFGGPIEYSVLFYYFWIKFWYPCDYEITIEFSADYIKFSQQKLLKIEF